MRVHTKIYMPQKNKPKKLHFHSTPRNVVVWVDDLQLPRVEAFFRAKELRDVDGPNTPQTMTNSKKERAKFLLARPFRLLFWQLRKKTTS